MMKGVLRFLLHLLSGVTIVDIVVVHWVLQRHRLFAGRHVLLAEGSLLLLSVLLIVALHRPHAEL